MQYTQAVPKQQKGMPKTYTAQEADQASRAVLASSSSSHSTCHCRYSPPPAVSTGLKRLRCLLQAYTSAVHPVLLYITEYKALLAGRTHLVQHLYQRVGVRYHFQLQALAGHPEGLLRDVTDGADGVIVLRFPQLQQQYNIEGGTT